MHVHRHARRLAQQGCPFVAIGVISSMATHITFAPSLYALFPRNTRTHVPVSQVHRRARRPAQQGCPFVHSFRSARSPAASPYYTMIP